MEEKAARRERNEQMLREREEKKEKEEKMYEMRRLKEEEEERLEKVYSFISYRLIGLNALPIVSECK